MALINPYTAQRTRKKKLYYIVLPILALLILIKVIHVDDYITMSLFPSSTSSSSASSTSTNKISTNQSVVNVNVNVNAHPITKDKLATKQAKHQQQKQNQHKHHPKPKPKPIHNPKPKPIHNTKSIHDPKPKTNDHKTESAASESASESASKSTFIPTLRGKKIFFEVVTVGLKQFSYLEEIIDSVRDMCEAGAHVSFHITSSNCNPNPDTNTDTDTDTNENDTNENTNTNEYVNPNADPDGGSCAIRNQSSETTTQDNFNIETISHLNERVKCRNPEGRLDTKIHLVSPDWGKQIVDHHRLLFYEHLHDKNDDKNDDNDNNDDQQFDVFVHTEDDTLIRPTTVLAFMHEMEKVRLLVGDERLPDYSIGFMRYENEVSREDRRRVIWEFEWEDEVDLITNENHPNLGNKKYFTSPPEHHQGMFMVLPQQLHSWKNRKPDCHFNKIERRYGYHTERISGALDIYDAECCNVTQLLPLDSVDDLLVHHLPNKNNGRSPLKILPTRDLHKMRMSTMQGIVDQDIDIDIVDQDIDIVDQDTDTTKQQTYNGIRMFMDERDKNHRMHFDLTDYDEYVKSGGRLTDVQLEIENEGK